jgi:hypothetical protein
MGCRAARLTTVIRDVVREAMRARGRPVCMSETQEVLKRDALEIWAVVEGKSVDYVRVTVTMAPRGDL